MRTKSQKLGNWILEESIEIDSMGSIKGGKFQNFPSARTDDESGSTYEGQNLEEVIVTPPPSSVF